MPCQIAASNTVVSPVHFRLQWRPSKVGSSDGTSLGQAAAALTALPARFLRPAPRQPPPRPALAGTPPVYTARPVPPPSSTAATPAASTRQDAAGRYSVLHGPPRPLATPYLLTHMWWQGVAGRWHWAAHLAEGLPPPGGEAGRGGGEGTTGPGDEPWEPLRPNSTEDRSRAAPGRARRPHRLHKLFS